MGHRKKVKLKKSKVKLSTLQNALQVKREFRTIVRNGTRGDFLNEFHCRGRQDKLTTIIGRKFADRTRHAKKSRWVFEREE